MDTGPARKDTERAWTRTGRPRTELFSEAEHGCSPPFDSFLQLSDKHQLSPHPLHFHDRTWLSKCDLSFKIRNDARKIGDQVPSFGR